MIFFYHFLMLIFSECLAQAPLSYGYGNVYQIVINNPYNRQPIQQQAPIRVPVTQIPQYRTTPRPTTRTTKSTTTQQMQMPLLSLDEEYNSTEMDPGLGNDYKGMPLKRCGRKPHPVLVISKMLHKRGIDEEFEKNICLGDYHLFCYGTEWPDCNVKEAMKFCPQDCNISICDDVKNQGKTPETKFEFVPTAKCKDKSPNCTLFYNRGDCFIMPQRYTTLCPRTCGFCTQNKDFAPFMFDQERLYWWLFTHMNGKYRQFAALLASKENNLKLKALGNNC